MVRLRTIEARADLRALVDELVRGGRNGELLSVYVDLDPRQFSTAPARRGGIAAAMDEAQRAAPTEGWMPVIEELRASFENSRYEIDGARGLLIYADEHGEATVVKLPRPVEAHVAFDHAVHVRPLVQALPGRQWCVLLCNRRSTRMLLGDGDGLAQIGAFRDEVDGQHDQGGWSQARFQRNIDGQVSEHLRHTARILLELQELLGFDKLLIAAPQELRAELEGELHDYTRRAFEGWVDADIEHSGLADIAQIAARRIAECDQRDVRRVLERLQQNAGTGRRAALGLEETLRAIDEQRVDTLLVAEGHVVAGYACRVCDWICATPTECPLHGRQMQHCADVVEEAVEGAIRQRAHVVTVPRGDVLLAPGEDGELEDTAEFRLLGSLGSVAAILRFDLDERADGPRGARGRG